MQAVIEREKQGKWERGKGHAHPWPRLEDWKLVRIRLFPRDPPVRLHLHRLGIPDNGAHRIHNHVL
jgi:hypothetical protein